MEKTATQKIIIRSINNKGAFLVTETHPYIYNPIDNFQLDA